MNDPARPGPAGTTTRSYRGPAHSGAPRLAELSGVDRVAPVTEAEVREHERFDTPDLRLLATGIGLAVERVLPDRAATRPETAAWVLSLPDSDDELRVALPATDVEGVDPAGVPEEIEIEIRRIRGEAGLRPVGRVRLVRNVTRLHDAAGAELALVLRDEVQVATLGAATEIENWTEATVVPGGAGSALLDGIDDALRTTGLIPGSRDGGARLAALLSGSAGEPPRYRATEGSAGALLLHYLARQADALAERERDLRADRPDAVHRMRVAARRARSALRTYRRLLEGPRVDHLVAELRWLGRALAGERDAEVQEERLTTQIAGLEPELVVGPVQAAVTRHFARTRAETAAAVSEVVDGERYAALRAALRRLLADPPLSAKAERSAARTMPAMVGRTARRFDRRMGRALADLDRGEQAPESLHDARKTGKQLRYATEVARPAAGKAARDFARKLKKVQDVLGAHQDAVVGRDLVLQLGGRAGIEDGNGFTFGVLHARDTERLVELEQRLPGTWEGVRRKKSRRWMRG
ncbi:CHAD domain-containing protein [Pseudonocardia nematodicida]|uniref:CHAD domain-containing protein n=1 Tax=Pseudonocardia nematodicida TaxID=1206997 RepID=A0ABV1KHZ3_9PSEU